MLNYCACGCGLRVAESGHHRRDCRRRELAAGRLCTPNVTSAAKARGNLKHNPKNNRINNPINNLKKNWINNPINALKKKRALRAANLQAVRDDPTKKRQHGVRLALNTRIKTSQQVVRGHTESQRFKHFSLPRMNTQCCRWRTCFRTT